LHEIFNKDIQQIFFIDEDMKRHLYEPYKNISSTSIAVFPGPIIPLSLGSHQRAFNLLSYLNKQHIYTDILITGNQKEFERYKKILKAIAPNVYTYKNTNRKFPLKTRLRKKSEIIFRKLLGYKDKTQDLFSERDFKKPTVSCRITLARLVNENKYKNIIINYAWLIKSLNNIKNFNNIKLICDTHDVQFIRNETQNKKTRRFFVNEDREKELEIRNLKKMDKIIAISDADYLYFQSTEVKDKVILGPTGFDYSFLTVKKRNPKVALSFGFIGTGMLANIESLKYILKNWWRDIKIFSPNSKFYIAGSICNQEEIIDAVFLDNSIELLGFVPSTKEFYRSVDVLLNPVIIAGGLNFKNIEPLIAGKHLITNELGAKSLKNINGLSIFNSSDSIIKFLTIIELDIEYDFQLRRKLQKAAQSVFSEKKAYTNIIKALKNE